MKHYEAGGFKVGDWVKVVNYGNIGWVSKEIINKMEGIGWNPRKDMIRVINENETAVMIELSPERIGKIDFIDQITETQGQIKISLSKSAWYNLDQLEKTEQPK